MIFQSLMTVSAYQRVAFLGISVWSDEEMDEVDLYVVLQIFCDCIQVIVNYVVNNNVTDMS